MIVSKIELKIFPAKIYCYFFNIVIEITEPTWKRKTIFFMSRSIRRF